MSFAFETSPPVGLSRSVASSYPRSFVPGFAERVRVPLLLVLTVAGLILYSQATDPSVGRLAVFAGITVAGAISGISGLAFPLIAGPIFLLMYPAPEAVALTAMCSLTGQLFSIALLWRVIAYEFRVPLIAAGLLGAPLGSALLCSFNPHCVRVVLGALIVVSGLRRALRVQVGATRRPSLLSEVLVGLTGGITGGLVGLHLWCQRSGVQRAASTSRASGQLLS